ncbi:MAG: hypothetical protein KBD46_03520 [Candidatus Levybacteria bacterium]|nr:hypothetical protein [Candidatus Levybacteria bacterium]
MKKLVLIDGNAILHRAYHAYPSLTNSKGEMVNAVYGFFTMILNLILSEKPDYFVVCFDRSKPTIRQSMYAGYHAHRPQMADDLSSQIALIDELLERMNVRIFAVDGYEGDDMIGTIATRVQSVKSTEKSGEIETIVVTGDRDMLQLVNTHTKILMPIIGITKSVLFDEERVEEKYGVKPSQFIDYKALIGDQSDGYPGVTGIGPKTAVGLLKQYETFEELYQNVGELPEKIGLKLATDAEQAALAKKLATIITDAPIQFDITKCSCTDFDFEALRVGFEAHGFKSLVARVDSKFPKEEKVISKKVSSKKIADNQLELL